MGLEFRITLVDESVEAPAPAPATAQPQPPPQPPPPPLPGTPIAGQPLPQPVPPPAPASVPPSTPGTAAPALLTPDELAAIKKYTAESFASINADLRERGMPYAWDEGTVAGLDSAFARSDVRAEPEQVYRGLNLPKDDQASQAFLDKMHAAAQSGEAVDFAEYLSTSRDPETARKFASGEHTSENTIPVEMQIAARHGLDVADASSEEGEQEMLLPRGGKYRVKSAQNDDGTHRFELEQLLEEAAARQGEVSQATERAAEAPEATSDEQVQARLQANYEAMHGPRSFPARRAGLSKREEEPVKPYVAEAPEPAIPAFGPAPPEALPPEEAAAAAVPEIDIAALAAEQRKKQLADDIALAARRKDALEEELVAVVSATEEAKRQLADEEQDRAWKQAVRDERRRLEGPEAIARRQIEDERDRKEQKEALQAARDKLQPAEAADRGMAKMFTDLGGGLAGQFGLGGFGGIGRILSAIGSDRGKAIRGMFAGGGEEEVAPTTETVPAVERAAPEKPETAASGQGPDLDQLRKMTEPEAAAPGKTVVRKAPQTQLAPDEATAAKGGPAPTTTVAKPPVPAAGAPAGGGAVPVATPAPVPAGAAPAAGAGAGGAAAGAAGGGVAAAAGPVGIALMVAEEGAKALAGGFNMLAGAVEGAGHSMADLARNDHMAIFNRGVDGASAALEKIPIVGQVYASMLQASIAPLRAFNEAVSAFVDRGAELAKYSFDITEARAHAEVRDIMADLREADALGEGIARLTDAQSQFSMEMRSLLLPIKQWLVETLASMLETVVEIIREGRDKITMMLDKLTDVLEAIESYNALAIPGIPQALEIIAGIRSSVARTDDEDPDLVSRWAEVGRAWDEGPWEPYTPGRVGSGAPGVSPPILGGF